MKTIISYIAYILQDQSGDKRKEKNPSIKLGKKVHREYWNQKNDSLDSPLVEENGKLPF